MIDDTSDAKLDEFDKDEWREVARTARPDLTDAEFDAMWSVFVEMKLRKEMQ